jgi:hypothetical protein
MTNKSSPRPTTADSPGSSPKPWFNSLRNPQIFFRRHRSNGSGSSSPTYTGGYGGPPGSDQGYQTHTLEPPRIAQSTQLASPEVSADVDEPHGNALEPPRVPRFMQPKSPPSAIATDFTFMPVPAPITVSPQRGIDPPPRVGCSELDDTSIRNRTPDGQMSTSTSHSNYPVADIVQSPELGLSSRVAATQSTEPSAREPSLAAPVSQQNVSFAPQIVVDPPPSDDIQGLTDEISFIQRTGFSPLIDVDPESMPSRISQRETPYIQTEIGETEQGKDETHEPDRGSGAAKDLSKARSTTNGASADVTVPVETATEAQPLQTNIPPTTPEMKKRTARVATSFPTTPPAMLNPVAPPLSRNPLASPANKSENVFENLIPMPAIPPISQQVDSPLFPPTTTSNIANDSSSQVISLEKDASTASERHTETTNEINTKPTCSLNLVCYRSGTKGCELFQIQTAKRSRYKDETAFQKAVAANPNLIVNDEQFFYALRDVYLGKMCNIWRRFFFLKTLRGIRLLSVSNPIVENHTCLHSLVHTNKSTYNRPT